MATTITRDKLSGSTDGMAIKVVGTATGSATTIHTATDSTTAGNYDEIYLYAYNSSSSAVVLSIEYGTTDLPITQTIAPQAGLDLRIPGTILQNSKVVKAFAGTTNVITILGWVNQIRTS